MVKFRLYKGGLDEVAMEFNNPEELKNNPEVKNGKIKSCNRN